MHSAKDCFVLAGMERVYMVNDLKDLKKRLKFMLPNLYSKYCLYKVILEEVKAFLLLLLPEKMYHWYCKIKNLYEPEAKILPKLLKERIGSAVDVGANTGMYTFLLLNLCEHVYAFEPQIGVYKQLEWRAKKKSKITTYNLGLGDKQERLSINIPISENGRLSTGYATFNEIKEQHRKETATIMTLDSFNYQNVSFIKIDVEGFEINVIRGSKETITREKPILLIEIEKRHLKEDLKINDVFEEILSYGYDGFFNYKNKLISIDKFSVDKMQNIKNIYTPKYINNFIFIPTN